jgi:hypothetical protein
LDEITKAFSLPIGWQIGYNEKKRFLIPAETLLPES